MVGTLGVALIAPTVAYIVATRQVSSALKVAKSQVKSAEAIAQKNFQGSVVAANRQRWLDEFRSDVANFVSEVALARGHRVNPGSDRLRAIYLAYARARMRINSSKPEQRSVVDQMKTIMSDVDAGDLDSKLEALMESVETVAATVWRKVKAGE